MLCYNNKGFLPAAMNHVHRMKRSNYFGNYYRLKEVIGMLENLITESRNPNSMNLDELSALQLIQLMNREDQNVVAAVERELASIEKVILQCVKCIKAGGRIIYVGAGTSGRIGLLDAVECTPTFGVDPNLVVGVLAGGTDQMFAKEEAEDSYELEQTNMQELHVCSHDIVIGLAASGRTPFVIGALDYAADVGAATACVTCNKGTEIAKHVMYPIEIDNGPEILTGSTRLKAGTSQKMVCNMISTGTMVLLGKVYENLMVDVDVSNEKLYHRWLSIVQTAAGCTEEQAVEAYELSHHNAKAAICMIRCGYSLEKALEELDKNGGMVRRVIEGSQV